MSTTTSIKKIVLLTLLLPAAFVPARAALISGELLTNPGAETGDLTGWTRSGITQVSADNGVYDPGMNPHTGRWQFVGDTYPGGGGSFGRASQTVSVVSIPGFSTAGIDSGHVAARVSFWEQSLYQGGVPDSARIELTFLDGLGQSLGFVFSSKLASAGSGGGGSHWASYQNDFALPGGTRGITYTMTFIRGENGGTYIDSFIDDNSLRLVTTVPDAGAGALLEAGLVLGFLFSVRRYVRNRATVA